MVQDLRSEEGSFGDAEASVSETKRVKFKGFGICMIEIIDSLLLRPRLE